MLTRVRALKGYKLRCLDGEIGRLQEFYFDDQYWTIRYLVIDTGNWLMDRQVLISPYALTAVNEKEQYFSIGLTKKQIEDSPVLENEKPVSQQFEGAYFGYFGWPTYWCGPHRWGSYPYIARDDEVWREPKLDEEAWEPHLRSTLTVSEYDIQALDGHLGKADDFIVDDQSWAIRYMAIDTGSWWPEKKTLISSLWIQRIDSIEMTVHVNLLRAALKNSPDYTENTVLSRDYESLLFRYYNHNGYWADKPADRLHAL